ncbi:MAG: hypoxanthine phosphoribosyltransferase [Bacteroidales bacterium]|nr:hypoxanthine phosphoribosyltransferase [Bacteroidales bacterium]
MSTHPKQVRLKDKVFELSYPEADIQHDIDVVAAQINRDYAQAENPPLFLCMLNGAFMFAADLLKRIEFACEVQFVKFSSYQGTQSTGEVKQVIGLNSDVGGRQIIVVEDIVETGTTLTALCHELGRMGAGDVRIASLLLKPNCYKGSVEVQYVGRRIPDDFIVGYGLDYDGLGRNLANIYTLV